MKAIHLLGAMATLGFIGGFGEGVPVEPPKRKRTAEEVEILGKVKNDSEQKRLIKQARRAARFTGVKS